MKMRHIVVQLVGYWGFWLLLTTMPAAAQPAHDRAYWQEVASMARREPVAPFMGAERYHLLVAEGIAYLQAERDLRGYDPTLHWIHATAHTGDLLADTRR